MLVSTRLSQLPLGVREMLATHPRALCRRSAIIPPQKRNITIEQLNSGRDSKSHNLHPKKFSQIPNFSLQTNTHPSLTRPRTRRNPRIRLGRLHRRPQPRPLQIPSRRCLSTLLFCLHPAPRQHRGRDPRIPDRPRARAVATHQSRFLPRVGRRCGFQEQDDYD
jgi:hypothetical protein